MNYQEGDELGANLQDAATFWHCRLSVGTAEKLIERVAARYPSPDFEALLESALDLELVTNEGERHAYKMALGMFFNRRAQAAREKKKEMRAIPFAPR